MTDAEPFRLMNRLTAQDRMVLECRYDGEIPKDAVMAMLNKTPEPIDVTVARLTGAATELSQQVRMYAIRRRQYRSKITMAPMHMKDKARSDYRSVTDVMRNRLESLVECRSKLRAIESSMAQE